MVKQPGFVKEISWLTDSLEGSKGQVRDYATWNHIHIPTWDSFSKDPLLPDYLEGLSNFTVLLPKADPILSRKWIPQLPFPHIDLVQEPPVVGAFVTCPYPCPFSNFWGSLGKWFSFLP